MVRTSGPIVLALTLAAILAAGCTERPNRVVQQEPAQRQRGFHFEGNNCPDHTPIRFVLANDSAVTLDALSVSGKITLIPEFHDCQRLIDDTGLKYGPLVGVYVSFLNAQIPALPPIPVVRRPSLSGGRPTQARVPTGASTITAATTAIAAAELVAFDGDYDTLGIKLGFNCLYLLNDGSATRVTARMVRVGKN
jgi:hypothetical protein